MKIRSVGTLEECLDAQKQLNKVFDIVEISPPYSSRGTSRLVRVYIDVRLDPERTRPARGEHAEPGRQRVTLHRLDRDLPGW